MRVIPHGFGCRVTAPVTFGLQARTSENQPPIQKSMAFSVAAPYLAALEIKEPLLVTIEPNKGTVTLHHGVHAFSGRPKGAMLVTPLGGREQAIQAIREKALSEKPVNTEVYSQALKDQIERRKSRTRRNPLSVMA